jgi:hypothetical protein
MGRLLASIVVLLSCVAAGPAMALDRGPVCREPSVIDEMTREIRDHNYYSEIDAKLVTETQTADLNLVRCQVCVLSAPYDTTSFGERPIRQCVEHRFEVQILPSGFVVHDMK